MKITDFSFGKIIIGDTTYTKDVIVFPNHVHSPWMRTLGHSLERNDLKEIIAAEPDVLVIGTGFYGAMKVPKETSEFLKAQGIEIYVEESKRAVELFNDISARRPAIAAIHLTC